MTDAATTPAPAAFLELPGALPALVDQVRGRAAAAARPLVVAIAGGSATGKSTFVAAPLAEALGAGTRVLAQDMHQRRGEQTALDPRWSWDDPANYGVEDCLAAIARFRRGEPIRWPRYDFATRSQTGEEEIPPGDCLLLEGLYAAHGPLADAVDLIVYVEARAIVRLIRRVLRNQHERYPGLAIAGRTAAGFLGRVLAAHEACVRPQGERAHLRVRTAPAFVHLRERFGLTSVPVAAARSVLRSVAFDAETDVAAVALGDGATHLRVLWRGACQLDAAIDEATMRAFLDFDPEDL